MRFAKTTSVISALTLAIASSMVLAKGPDHRGPHHGKGHSAKHWDGGKHHKRAHRQAERYKRHHDRHYDRGRNYHDRHYSGIDIYVSFFGDRHRRLARDYYQEHYYGHCPPGLAMKRNGCMPPGQAKKWRRGYPLGPDITYYDLDRHLRIRLGPPPDGHRYVRVASDILLLAVGTNLVVDAIENLGRY